MVAASNEFFHSNIRVLDDENPAFIGEWVLDRVSGLVDCANIAIQRLRIDAHALHLQIKRLDDASFCDLSVELNGEAVETRNGTEAYCLQALLEADALVWELEQISSQRNARIRRVMRTSQNGEELIVDRVDMNAQGVPIALRTEYWTRVGRHPAVPLAELTE
jgi:hypothetical protein